MEPVRIDMDELANYIQWKMNEKKLSLRDVAEETKVSAATLSRLLRKGKKRPQPDVDTLVKLMRWAQVPLEKVVEAGQSRGGHNRTERSTPEAIEVHLRADKNLSAQAAEAIAKMVRVAYAEFASQRRRTHE